MPIYEYQCGKGHVSEKFFSISGRRTIVQCLACKKPAHRIISGPIVHGFEEYHSEELGDEGSSDGFVVKSRGHLKQRLKDLRLEQVDPTYESRARKKRGTIYSLPSKA